MKTKILAKKKVDALKEAVSKNKWLIIAIITCLYASTFGFCHGADAQWQAIVNLILPWVKRLGGALVFIGGIEWGIGFRSDNPEQKTGGVKFAIAGCIIFAVGVGGNAFLA